jgi:hypothetical protein
VLPRPVGLHHPSHERESSKSTGSAILSTDDEAERMAVLAEAALRGRRPGHGDELGPDVEIGGLHERRPLGDRAQEGEGVSPDG